MMEKFEQILESTRAQVKSELNNAPSIIYYLGNWIMNLPEENAPSGYWRWSGGDFSPDFLHPELVPWKKPSKLTVHSELYRQITPRAFWQIRDDAMIELGIDRERIIELSKKRFNPGENRKEIVDVIASETLDLYVYMLALGFNREDLTL